MECPFISVKVIASPPNRRRKRVNPVGQVTERPQYFRELLNPWTFSKADEAPIEAREDIVVSALDGPVGLWVPN